jgi:diacylglycerol kinase (ATP)
MGAAPGAVTRVAVIAHAGKSLDGGLPELRRSLAEAGIDDPLWFEVPKSRKAPKRVRRALADGAELLIAWGGDGLVQRCIDAMEGADAELGIIPAGTANLLASNLGIPADIDQAVAIALGGSTRHVDVGTINGERFAVMAGAGFDAGLIRGADGGIKQALGRAAYVVSGARAIRAEPFGARIKVDGATWFDGPAGCVLFGNVGALFGGITVFEDAKPDDGLIDLAVISAAGVTDWARVAARTALSDIAGSPLVQVTRARRATVRLDRRIRYEIDGGDRDRVKRLRVTVEPGALRVRVP